VPVNRRFHSPLWSWISVFALIAQLWMPTAHALTWAKQAGDPLLFAYCGTGAPSLARQLRDTAPPELLAKLRADQADTAAAMACDLCAAVHGAPALSDSHAGIALALVRPDTVPVARVAEAPTANAPRPFDARGPPVTALN